VLPIIEKLKTEGFTSFRAVAAELNARRVATVRGIMGREGRQSDPGQGSVKRYSLP